MNTQPQQSFTGFEPEITIQTNEAELVFPLVVKRDKRKRSSVYLTQAFEHLEQLDSPREVESMRELRSKSVGRRPEMHVDRKIRLLSCIDAPEKNKIRIIFETPRKNQTGERGDKEDEENQVTSIDLSRTIREDREKKYDGGGISIMATALTAAALSGYFVIRGFKAFFT